MTGTDLRVSPLDHGRVTAVIIMLMIAFTGTTDWPRAQADRLLQPRLSSCSRGHGAADNALLIIDSYALLGGLPARALLLLPFRLPERYAGEHEEFMSCSYYYAGNVVLPAIILPLFLGIETECFGLYGMTAYVRHSERASRRASNI
jgi:hypothetical protein